jgi:hypothetical protein
MVFCVGLSISACTFDLGTARAPAGVSQLQLDTDKNTCQHDATIAAHSTGKQIGEFFLGMTIIGIPGAMAIDRSVQRSTYRDCMTTKGYSVTLDGTTTPPTGKAASNQIQPATANVPVVSTPSKSKISIDAGDGWVKQDPPERLQGPKFVTYLVNSTVDAGLHISSEQLNTITDIYTFAQTKQAAQENNLTNIQSSPINKLRINGHNAYRFTVSGASAKGTRLTFLFTIIEGAKEIAVMNVWTTAANFERQGQYLESLSLKLSGL